MATTKAATTAKNKNDVDVMDAKQRTWDSLNYSYGKKKDNSNAAYDQAISQQDNAMLKRGMQRSSYGAQVRAGMLDQKVQAANDIDSEMIADYENRLYQIERDEKADEQWERQFKEGQRQFNASYGLQQGQFAEQKEQNAWSRAFQEKQFEVQNDQWREQFDFNKKNADQQIAMNYVMNAIQNGNVPTDDLLERAGLSRADANLMIQQTATVSGGGGGYRPPKDTGDTDKPGTNQNAYNWAMNLFGNPKGNTKEDAIFGRNGTNKVNSIIEPSKNDKPKRYD